MNPTVSIIVVTYNSAKHLPACCQALSALRYTPAPEIVVVDNASQDESAQLVRQLLPQARILSQERNLGFAGGVHEGVAASRGSHLVLLNPDTIVSANWLHGLIETLAKPGCGIAGSKILDSQSDRLLHTGGAVSYPETLASHRGEGELDRGQYETAEAVSFVTGASLALSRELWDRLGGLDRGFFPGYFEDVDLCWRAQALGFACWYTPNSLLRHHESASTGKFSGAFYYYHHRNRLRFLCKQRSWVELWNDFSPAEARRLVSTSALDRAIGSLVYREGLPAGLTPPDEGEQARILQLGQTLRSIKAEQANLPATWPEAAQQILGIPTASQSPLAELLATAKREAVLEEHQFHSRIPIIAKLRSTWNEIATRWYILPLMHQQTRYNLAVQRSLLELQTQSTANHALLETQVRQALLGYRVVNQNVSV
ncbi:MAG: glycosyltransferase family 2 protein [Candidatus Viridilinea halotolerans]|uniref:Glycosyltransferase family 2 protein n=1 Tax=Candidatus Viridilinea halotolerans TaxID=2491704 RepID=A0A426U069_9CHLR|nr:MAG: glycosyltransferase family 2 protein [Candidatus Viridilinea halotolerans]